MRRARTTLGRPASRRTRRLVAGATALCAVALSVLPATPAAAAPPGWAVTSSTTPAITNVDDVACPSASICYAAGTTQGGVSVIRATANGGATWHQAIALPPTILLSGISCVSTTTCVGVSFLGSTFVTTSDGWSTISQVNAGSDVVLSAVECAPTGLCAASGSTVLGEDLLLTSSNAGATWKTHTVPGDFGAELNFGFELNSVSCATARICLVTGEYLARVNKRLVATPAFFRTGTGGATWHRIDLPSFIGALGSVACPSASRCYATAETTDDGVVVTSTNAGATWRVGLRWLNFGPTALSCPTAEDCVVAASGAGQAIDVAKTTNGGTGWARHTVSSSVGFPGGGLSCATTTACLAGVNFRSSPAYLEASVNGGTSWSVEDSPTWAPIPRSISCPVADTCEAVGNQIGVGLTSTGFAERTTNNGTTWTAQSLPGGLDAAFFVTCPSTTTCYAIGEEASNGDEVIIGTTNSGTTWSQQATPSSTTAYVSIACPSTTQCVATGYSSGPTIVRTTNGGTTWTTESLPAAPSGVQYAIDAVTCTSTSDCIASGAAQFNSGFSEVATFFSSSDGGVTWTALSLAGEGQFDSTDLPGVITCTSATTCISVSSSPSGIGILSGTGSVSVFETTNSGATWTEEHTIGAAITQIGDVSCASGGFCQMVGEDSAAGTSYALASSDGGITWSSSKMPATWLFSEDISCQSATDCVSLGATTSGGLGVATFS